MANVVNPRGFPPLHVVPEREPWREEKIENLKILDFT